MQLPDRSAHPLVTVVTPCLNPGRRLGRCLESVRTQSYPEVEHIVIDGGSTDGTTDLLRAQDHARWMSEPDEGQAAAINKGFRLAAGEIVGWLNADDMLTPKAIEEVVAAFRADAEIGWVFGDVLVVAGDQAERRRPADLSKPVSWGARSASAQPGSFHTRWSLDAVGYLDERFHYMMDFDLWLRLLDAGIAWRYLPEILAVFEVHAESKSGGLSHAAFLEEEAEARHKNGRLRTAALALGREAAWKARDAGSLASASLEREIASAVCASIERGWDVPASLIRAGAVTEHALLVIKENGLRGLSRLTSSEIWRHSETRWRIRHAAERATRRRLSMLDSREVRRVLDEAERVFGAYR